ncbi:hypothetical protein [Sulfurovum sp.]|uniref:hypothetical protein n=1 Tax=Sulfurovum sp. TaxID=1969726 RepID=UPI002633E50F|nr:hypothetical protein [Sulfurovum sp.]
MSCEVKKKEQVWEFNILNGNTGIMQITDPLLDTEARAEQRAMSEFLKNSYANNAFRFNTSRTALALNQIINIDGVPYLVKSLSYGIDEKKISVNVGVLRYD